MVKSNTVWSIVELRHGLEQGLGTVRALNSLSDFGTVRCVMETDNFFKILFRLLTLKVPIFLTVIEVFDVRCLEVM